MATRDIHRPTPAQAGHTHPDNRLIHCMIYDSEKATDFSPGLQGHAQWPSSGSFRPQVVHRLCMECPGGPERNA
ncbi:hypothetical protein, partial [Haemophilus influenzae]|uniref:hypothetical protein n=1 Tax=Haemophilus influenzae TaxID=727 RepID=UPI001952FB99